MIKFAAAVLFFLASSSPAAQEEESWCGLFSPPAPTPEAGFGCTVGVCMNEGPCDIPANRNAQIPNESTPIVPVSLFFNVLCEGGACSGIAEAVETQVQQLNIDFGPSRFHFFYQIRFVADSRFYLIDTEAKEFQMKELYAVNASSNLNVFVTQLPNPVLGDGVLAWDFGMDPIHGGIMIRPAALATSNFASHVLTHEVGHALGLWHTYHGVSEVPPCSVCYECPGASPGENDLRGDFCEDTPPTPFSVNCVPSGVDTCTNQPWFGTDFTNFMRDGLDDPSACMSHFTDQQKGRMHCWFADMTSGWYLDNPTIRVPFDFLTIGDAISFVYDASLAEATIVVSDGVHSGPKNRGLNLWKLNTTIRIVSENGPDNCTIDCQNADRAFSVSGGDVVIDGFTIVRGDAGNSTGGAISSSGAGLTLRNLTISDCAAGFGGAIAARPGGTFFDPQDVLIENCRITDNSAFYHGGGIDSGVGGVESGRMVIVDSIISDNHCGVQGGGLKVFRLRLELRNCTIANNIAEGNDYGWGGSLLGGGINLEWMSSPSVIANCILWGNEVQDSLGAVGDQAAFDDCCGNAVFSYSDVQGGPQYVYNLDEPVQWGPGNLNSNPLFVAPSFGDYHIQKVSPCINRGDPSYAAFPGETDVDGEVRVMQNRVDIGADERRSIVQ